MTVYIANYVISSVLLKKEQQHKRAGISFIFCAIFIFQCVLLRVSPTNKLQQTMLCRIHGVGYKNVIIFYKKLNTIVAIL